MNDGIAALKSKLKNKDNDIINLKTEIDSIQAANKTMEAKLQTSNRSKNWRKM